MFSVLCYTFCSTPNNVKKYILRVSKENINNYENKIDT